MQQLEFDLRLDYERNLKDNLITVAKFAQEQMKQDLSDNGRPLKTVESEQEAYGIAAQQYVKVGAKAKMLKGGMDDFLKLLDADGEVTQVAGTGHRAGPGRHIDGSPGKPDPFRLVLPDAQDAYGGIPGCGGLRNRKRAGRTG